MLQRDADSDTDLEDEEEEEGERDRRDKRVVELLHNEFVCLISLSSSSHQNDFSLA